MLEPVFGVGKEACTMLGKVAVVAVVAVGVIAAIVMKNK